MYIMHCTKRPLRPQPALGARVAQSARLVTLRTKKVVNIYTIYLCYIYWIYGYICISYSARDGGGSLGQFEERRNVDGCVYQLCEKKGGGMYILYTDITYIGCMYMYVYHTPHDTEVAALASVSSEGSATGAFINSTDNSGKVDIYCIGLRVNPTRYI